MVKVPFGLVAAAAIVVGLAGSASVSAQTAAAPSPAPVAPAPTPAPAPAAPAPSPASPAPTPAARPHKASHAAAKPAAHKQHTESLQTALNANGAHLTVDGRMGAKTRAALKAYQQKHNLKVTGQPDSATLKALGIGS